MMQFDDLTGTECPDQPAVGALAADLYPLLVLPDENVVGKRRRKFVMVELVGLVVLRSRVTQYLDDHGWIRDRSALCIRRMILVVSADQDRVRIGRAIAY